jgi:hypothetical protein
MKFYNGEQPMATRPARKRRPLGLYLNRFRVPIYVQLCVVICILCGICVMVVAVATVLSPSIHITYASTRTIDKLYSTQGEIIS